MRVVHSGHLNVKSGGPALSCWLTVKGLRDRGIDAEVIMPPLENGDSLIDEAARPIIYSKPKFGTLAFVPGLRKTLAGIGDADLYHIQGVWMLHGLTISKFARDNNMPYLVTLRGMLYPQAIRHNGLVKKISLALYQSRILKNAACIQCTCKEEMEYYRALGFRNPVAILPNPIDVCHVKVGEKKDDTFRIGYLGRLHTRKRVERLIYAMSDLRESLPVDSELVIIGGGDSAYEEFLRSEVKRLGLDNVVFTGFLVGADKEKALESLSILAVPSDYENFGNIVTEALSKGVPVLSSKGTPWQILNERNCGWWVDNSQESIDKHLLSIADMPKETLKAMGLNGRDLMENEYSVESLGKKMEELYQWILGYAAQPSFVYD